MTWPNLVFLAQTKKGFRNPILRCKTRLASSSSNVPLHVNTLVHNPTQSTATNHQPIPFLPCHLSFHHHVFCCRCIIAIYSCCRCQSLSTIPSQSCHCMLIGSLFKPRTIILECQEVYIIIIVDYALRMHHFHHNMNHICIIIIDFTSSYSSTK